jgi:helix-turn-helix protein
MSDGHQARDGAGLRLARRARGLSQQQLALMAGVSRQAISGVESGASRHGEPGRVPPGGRADRRAWQRPRAVQEDPAHRPATAHPGRGGLRPGAAAVGGATGAA